MTLFLREGMGMPIRGGGDAVWEEVNRKIWLRWSQTGEGTVTTISEGMGDVLARCTAGTPSSASTRKGGWQGGLYLGVEKVLGIVREKRGRERGGAFEGALIELRKRMGSKILGKGGVYQSSIGGDSLAK